MSILLRQSTASQEVVLGPFLDDVDGKTAETALSIANTDIKVWKNGATSEASKNSGGATHMAAGRYSAVLDATDTDTLGAFELNVHVSGALPVKRERLVVPAMIYDALVLGTDRLDTNITHAADVAWGSGAITRAAFAADTGLQSIRSNTAQAGAASTITLDAGASAVNDFYEPGTSIILTGGTGAGQYRLFTGYVGSTKVATVDAAWATNPDATSTFALFPAAASVAEIAAAVWDLATSGHTTAGTFGAQAKTALDALITTVGASAAGVATAVWAAATRLLTAGTNIVLAKGTGVTGFNDLDAAGVRTAVGLGSANLDTQIGDVPTNAELATAIAAALTATIADSIPADGTRPSLQQGIYMLVQFMLERGVVGTTGTVYKVDGTTPLFTLTLNSATVPTAVTRTT